MGGGGCSDNGSVQENVGRPPFFVAGKLTVQTISSRSSNVGVHKPCQA